MNFVRNGMMAHMNLSGMLATEHAAALEREEAALMLAHMMNDCLPAVAATRIGNTRSYQTHYMGEVRVRYLRSTPKHTLVRTAY